MRRRGVYLVTLALVFSLLVLGVVGCAQPTPAGETKPAPTAEAKPAPTEAKPTAAATKPAPVATKPAAEAKPAAGGEVKLGALIPYTGIGAMTAKDIEQGIKFAIERAGGQTAGKKIALVTEDETDDPSIAVAKARKLVEQDKVVGVIGPLLAHNAAAVAAFLAPSGIPNINFGNIDGTESKDSFYAVGTGKGNAYPVGVYAYDELGAKTAAVLAMDYSMGEQSAVGFIDGFTSKGGKIVSRQKIPMGAADMAPFIEGIGKADLVAALLVNPSDMAFVRQYTQAGLKMPVVFISNSPQEEPVLAQMGDAVLGMYGASLYSPLIDTPFNKQFVQEYTAKYGGVPGGTTQAGYLATAMYLEAIKSTGGDTDKAKITQALLGIKNLENPGGLASVSPGRIVIQDLHIFKAIKIGSRYAWSVVKTIPQVQPR